MARLAWLSTEQLRAFSARNFAVAEKSVSITISPLLHRWAMFLSPTIISASLAWSIQLYSV